MPLGGTSKFDAALVCRRETWVFIDHVRDKVRSRALAILSWTALFAVTALLIFSEFYRDPRALVGEPVTNSFNVIFVSAQADLETRALPAKFRLVNFQGFGVAGARMTALVSAFQVSYGKEAFAGRCDPFLAVLQLESLRYLCSSLVGNVVQTDEFGVADFTGLAFSSGALPGTYNLSFVESTQGFSASFFVSLSSRVSAITIEQPDLDGSTGMLIAINDSLPDIHVRVAGASPDVSLAGLPVRLVPYMFSGDDMAAPDNNQPLNFKPRFLRDVRAGKFLLVDGGMNVTDATGLAVLRGARILGANTKQLFAAVLCDSMVAPLFVSFVDPPQLVSPVASLTVVNAPAASVIEGELLAEQPVVRVADSAGAPLAGRVVFASIAAINGAPTPEFLIYRPTGSDGLKSLTGAISLPSDEQGLARFAELSFNVAGPAGAYALAYTCDGVRFEALGTSVAVLSSVAQVSFTWAIPAVNVPALATDSPIVTVRNAAGAPISGKTADIMLDVPHCGLTNGLPSLSNGVALFDLLIFLAVDMTGAENPLWRTAEARVVVDGVVSTNAITVNLSLVPSVLTLNVPSCIDADMSSLPAVLVSNQNYTLPLTFRAPNFLNVGLDLTILFVGLFSLFRPPF